ncbi:MAG TPA: hypothetical protein PLK97_10350, partial [Pseudomonadales bacterium]|nr:hypothetical protein [Pseudomonadales bacterium]
MLLRRCGLFGIFLLGMGCSCRPFAVEVALLTCYRVLSVFLAPVSFVWLAVCRLLRSTSVA